MTALGRMSRGLRTFASDVARGFFEITHNGFAVLGLAVAFAVVTLTARPDLRVAGEHYLMGWLQERQASLLGFAVERDASERATAANPADLPRQQAQLTFWLSRKYKVAPEPVAALVAEAYEVGKRTRLDPTLILAVMAIESGFNPFAQSPMGAQGLMQVMTGVHSDKYAGFGGKLAAFDPVTNLRVGVKVLQESIARAGGSVEGGLRHYVGAANLDDDGGYTAKVLAEMQRLQLVVQGQSVPLNTAANSQPAGSVPGQPVRVPAFAPVPAPAAVPAVQPAAVPAGEQLALG